MNMIKKMLILATSILLLTYSVQAADEPNLKEIDYLKKIDLIHLELKDSLVITEKTGDLNIDFLNQTIHYERALIALTKNELQYGERKELKEPINELINHFKLNLKKISKVQKQISENPVFDEAKEASYLASYEEIHQQILNELKSEGTDPTVLIGNSIDNDFLSRLLKQCDVFIVFVNNLLSQTQNAEVTELANDLIKSTEELKVTTSKLIEEINQ